MLPKRYINIEQIEKFYRIEEDGAIFSFRSHKYIKPTFNTAGYLYAFLAIADESGGYNNEMTRSYAVHRLVATKYIGQCPEELETSHRDGDKMNNYWTNLKYITHSANILQSYREHGRKVPQSLLYPRHPFSDHTKELMSNAKKKRVKYLMDGIETTFLSIEDASQRFNTYRRKIYTCIKDNKQFVDKKTRVIGGFFSFIDV